jgi:hypothetical protein
VAGYIASEGNTIAIHGDFTLRELPRLLAAMHTTVNSKGYSDFSLNFQACTSAYAGPMLGLAAHAQHYWAQGVDVALTLLKEDKLSRLFRNANWAHLIDVRGHEPSRFTGTSQVPAIRYQNAAEQFAAVNRILNILFGALSDFSRNDLKALEWSLNEVTDNVLNHAQSKVGGFVQVTNFSARAKRLEFAVADPGIGIPGSLRPSRPKIRTDQEALDLAIREGVTRSPDVGQGNGLFGTWRIAQLSQGRLNILSGYASLESNPESGLHVGNQAIPFNGTLVVANIPYAQPVDLGEAFRFGGQKHEPLDYVDLHFDVDSEDRPILRLVKESEGFGSREAGRIVRNKLLNLLKLADESVVIDFDEIPLISSSYADEVLGMLFASLGPVKFLRNIRLINVQPEVESLINRAILQRSKQ